VRHSQALYHQNIISFYGEQSIVNGNIYFRYNINMGTAFSGRCNF